MTALQDAADFANDPRLTEPLTAAMVATAVMVIAEAPETTSHEPRVELARRVIFTPSEMVDRFRWVISTNATVVGKWAADDIDGAVNDLMFVLSTLWNAAAGIALY